MRGVLQALAIGGGLALATPVLAKLGSPTPRIVLFQGDSITDGGRAPGTDLNHIMGQSYAYIVAGELGSASPACAPTFVNRGVSGNTVEDLQRRWSDDAIALRPDLVSILVGANDVFFAKGGTVASYTKTYAALIARTRAELPGVRIVLGEPFVLPVGAYAADYAANRARLKPYQEAVRTLAAANHLTLIPYQALFDAAMRRAPAQHWAWDGIHPTYAGHGLMAKAWEKAVFGRGLTCK